VGAYLGLCPRRDQSGGTDKQLRISKCGDGLRLAGTGSAREKKRAVVAVARKLAVLLLSLWKHGTNYEPRVTASPVLVMTPA
jgi:transposase